MARAKNGTGKTAAFVIPVLEQIDQKKDYIQALILLPTRELALQTSAVVKSLGKYMDIKCMVSTGGTSLRNDIYRLQQEVHVLVGRVAAFLTHRLPREDFGPGAEQEDRGSVEVRDDDPG